LATVDSQKQLSQRNSLTDFLHADQHSGITQKCFERNWLKTHATSKNYPKMLKAKMGKKT
jgi:hypothetical protein